MNSTVTFYVTRHGETLLNHLHKAQGWVDSPLTEKGIQIHRTDVGNFATSMDMVGMSVTLVKLDDEIKELLDAPCDTPYYKL